MMEENDESSNDFIGREKMSLLNMSKIVGMI